MNRIVSAQGGQLKNCLAAARRVMGVPLARHREKLRSGGEDGLYRVELESGDIVECTVIHRAPCAAHEELA